jgi:hypothetical protein
MMGDMVFVILEGYEGMLGMDLTGPIKVFSDEKKALDYLNEFPSTGYVIRKGVRLIIE